MYTGTIYNGTITSKRIDNCSINYILQWRHRSTTLSQIFFNSTVCSTTKKTTKRKTSSVTGEGFHVMVSSKITSFFKMTIEISRNLPALRVLRLQWISCSRWHIIALQAHSREQLGTRNTHGEGIIVKLYALSSSTQGQVKSLKDHQLLRQWIAKDFIGYSKVKFWWTSMLDNIQELNLNTAHQNWNNSSWIKPKPKTVGGRITSATTGELACRIGIVTEWILVLYLFVSMKNKTILLGA